MIEYAERLRLCCYEFSSDDKETADRISGDIVDCVTAFVTYVEFTPNGQSLTEKATACWQATNQRILEVWPQIEEREDASMLLKNMWYFFGRHYNVPSLLQLGMEE